MVYAVIVAAGKGVRMKCTTLKQYLELEGVPLLSITLKAFDKCSLIDEIILVVPSGDIGFCLEKIINPAGIQKKVTPVAGGLKRQDSVYNGLLAVDEKVSTVVIHDGVRPFINPSIIEECIREAVLHGACILGLPVSDTLKLADGSGYIKKTLERDSVWLAQTPQAFDYSLIKKAHDRARKEGFKGTDDASLVERIGEKVKIIRGSIENIKITTPEDLVIARAILGSGKL
ncbi:MAG: 2-C-methyl-D-erythritol 4-phosphate cytidylyltransferase [Desulfobacteraceae bacterium A6]|nr:MAG: 2-C-methyl-D-erythritol 4-phosphate cytidylyltransferase [Desulfobacteraceae bacterium A6]